MSHTLATLMGREREELLGLTDFDIFTDEHASVAYADEQRVIATGIPMLDKEEHETWPDRGDTWVTSNKRPLRDFDGRIIGTFGLRRDITRTVNAERDAPECCGRACSGARGSEPRRGATAHRARHLGRCDLAVRHQPVLPVHERGRDAHGPRLHRRGPRAQ